MLNEKIDIYNKKWRAYYFILLKFGKVYIPYRKSLIFWMLQRKKVMKSWLRLLCLNFESFILSNSKWTYGFGIKYNGIIWKKYLIYLYWNSVSRTNHFQQYQRNYRSNFTKILFCLNFSNVKTQIISNDLKVQKLYLDQIENYNITYINISININNFKSAVFNYHRKNHHYSFAHIILKPKPDTFIVKLKYGTENVQIRRLIMLI